MGVQIVSRQNPSPKKGVGFQDGEGDWDWEPLLPKNQLLVELRAAEDFGAGALGAAGGFARAVCNGAWGRLSVCGNGLEERGLEVRVWSGFIHDVFFCLLECIVFSFSFVHWSC